MNPVGSARDVAACDLEAARTKTDEAGKIHSVTRFGATMELVVTQLGTGVLLLPFCFSQAGIIASVSVLVIAGAVAGSRAALLAECFDIAEAKCSLKSLSFISVAQASLGKWGERAVSFSLSATLFSVSLAYLMLWGNLLASLQPWHGLTLFWSQVVWKAVATLFLLAASFMKGMSEMQWVGTVGTLATLLVVMVVVSAAVIQMGEAVYPVSWAPRHGSALLGSITTFCYSFGAIMTLPTIAQDMQDRAKDLKPAVYHSHVLSTGLYLLIGLVAYLGFGSDVQQDVLDSLKPRHRTLWLCGVGCILLHLVMAIPVLVQVVIRSVEERLPSRPWTPVACRVAIVLTLFLLACTPISIFEDFVAIVPATGVTLNCFVWPAVVYWGLMRKVHGGLKHALWEAPGRFAVDFIVVVLALAAMVLGTKAGVEHLLADLHKGSH